MASRGDSGRAGANTTSCWRAAQQSCRCRPEQTQRAAGSMERGAEQTGGKGVRRSDRLSLPNGQVERTFFATLQQFGDRAAGITRGLFLMWHSQRTVKKWGSSSSSRVVLGRLGAHPASAEQGENRGRARPRARRCLPHRI
eukprot:363414-Chlamydomonas_euryale.AAC.10